MINSTLTLLFSFIFSLFLPMRCLAGSVRETPVVLAVRNVGPAVVNVSTEFEVVSRSPFSTFGDPFFDSFFKDFFDQGDNPEQKRHNLGSGVLIDGKRGLIITNAHVIEKTGMIKITLKDEHEFDAQIIGADPDSDLAVLKINSDSPLPAVEMGNSDNIMIGETVIAIGNPFGFNHTVTTGVISAVNRSVRTEERVYNDFIQTDTSINPGNSGGPLLNLEGELIGINTAIYAGAQGIGFAIPINKAKRIISNLIKYGEVIQAWIGIDVQDLAPDMARYLGVQGGVLVHSVESESPAFESGVREGDIILSIGNMKILSSDDYESATKSISAGDTVELRILKQNREKKLFIETKAFPYEKAKEMIQNVFGIETMNLSTSSYQRYTTANEGVVITKVQSGSYLARIGAKPGDVIRQVDDIIIRNVQDFEKAVVKYRMKKSIVLLLQRGERGYYITIKLHR